MWVIFCTNVCRPDISLRQENFSAEVKLNNVLLAPTEITGETVGFADYSYNIFI